MRFDAREVQRNFDPAVGFVQRRDYRRYRGQVYYGPRPRDNRVIRRTEYDANMEVVTDLRNEMLERLVNLTVFGVQFHSQDNFGVEVDPSYVRLDRPFTIAPGITWLHHQPQRRVESDRPEGRELCVERTPRSPFMALVNIVQFDTMSRVLGWQSRYRWILRPGNDLYLVYTHNWVEEPLVDRFATLDRRAASKVLYTHRF